MENWKKIEGFENYSVSDLGRVRNDKTGRIMKTPCNGHGYPSLNLEGKSGRCFVKVHQLVAKAFLPNPEEKKTINHKNGIKSDNTLTNLEWATHSENTKHALKNGLIDKEYLILRAKKIGFQKGDKLSKEHKDKISQSVSGFGNPRCKITPENLKEIFALRELGHSQNYIAEKIGVHYSGISKILNNKRKFIQ